MLEVLSRITNNCVFCVPCVPSLLEAANYFGGSSLSIGAF